MPGFWWKIFSGAPKRNRFIEQAASMCSFTIEEFYSQAISSSRVDPGPVLRYIMSFDKVVLWGAANFGKAIGAFLLQNGVKISAYWDLRAFELKEVNGLRVIDPFTGGFDPNNTLVIFCINNNVLKSKAWNRLREMGYHNSIKGEYFFMGTMCPFTDETGVKASVCTDDLICRFVCCERLSSILSKRCQHLNSSKPSPPIHLVYACIIVNSTCTLNCKYCVQFINNYPKTRRVNVPTDRVCHDIRSFLGAVDTIAGVSVMGGETFLHPDIHLIAGALSEQQNFGLASFPTSGTVPMDPKKLEYFRDPRLSINFGNYTGVLSPRRLDIYYRNVERVKSMGLSYTIGNPMLEWIKPSTLYALNKSVEEMIRSKRGCKMPPRNLQARGGRLHPCDLGVALHNIGIADYPEDYVDIAGTPGLNELREKIRNFIDAPYYRSCGHCNGYPDTCEAMAQGYHDYTQPSNDY